MPRSWAPIAVLLLFLLAPFTSLAAAPTITSIGPAKGMSFMHMISGTGFQKGVQVSVDGVPAPAWQGGTRFVFFQPSIYQGGAVQIIVTNPDGGSATSRFTLPPSTPRPVTPQTPTPATTPGQPTGTSAGSGGSHWLNAKQKAQVDTALQFAPLTPRMRRTLLIVKLTGMITSQQKADLDKALDLVPANPSRLLQNCREVLQGGC